MLSMKYFNQEKTDFIATVFSELKILGVKVPKVKKFKSNFSKLEKSGTDPVCKIFGVSLDDQEYVQEGDYFLPKFIVMAASYLQRFSNKEVGLFRKAGNVARQKKLRLTLEDGKDLEGSDPNDVACLLKQWLRELPESLIPPCLQDLFVRCLTLNENNRVTAFLLTCLLLIPGHLHTLKYLLRFLSEIASNSERNKMNIHNLALIMAPNIFRLQDSSDDLRNNSVQQHTRIMEILIENFAKVGEIPPSVTFQNCQSSELDSSSDFLDVNVNKTSKKKRSGGMQDIFSGFKKLVGQNGGPTSRSETPENHLQSSLHSGSASKRKADLDLQSLSAVKNKKKACSLDDLDNTSLGITPKRKGMFHSGTEKITNGHVRRKSIGALLRRKNRKRGASNKTPQETLQLFDLPLNHPVNDVKINVPEPKFPTDKLHPPYGNEKILVQPGSIEKSVSDCCLPVSKKEFFVLPSITVSSSQGCLPDRPIKKSPYNLRSEVRINAQSNKAISLEKKFMEDKENGKKRDSEARAKEEISVMTDTNRKIFKDSFSPKSNIPYIDIASHPEDQVFNGVEIKDNIPNVGFTDSEKVCKYLLPAVISNKNYNLTSEANTSPKQVTSSTNCLNNLKVDNKHSDDLVRCKAGLTRQEAFVVKSVRNNLKSSNVEAKNINKKYEERNSRKLHKKSSNNLNVPKSDDICSKRNTEKLKKTRHGSLIRGRPNSVNTGLPSTQPKRYSNDSVLALNSEIKLSTRDSSLHTAVESPSLQSLDLSLSILLQNFCLSSPNSRPELSHNIGIASDNNNSKVQLKISPKNSEEEHSLVNRTISESTTPLTRSQINRKSPSIKLTVSQKKKSPSSYVISDVPEDATPPQKPRKRLSSNSDSKIPRLRNISASRTNRANSFPSKKSGQNHINQSSIFPEPLCERQIPLSKENISCDISLKVEELRNDCFKTPNHNTSSPTSTTWMSGSTLFSTLISPQEEEEIISKRESIAMILKNNTGHVQAKVSLYDNRFPSSERSSASKSDCLPDERILRTSSQKRPSSCKREKSSISTGYDSANRSSSVRTRGKYQRSPLPPPPKFTLIDVQTPSPKVNYPLKEVTNFNVGDSSLGISPKNLFNHNTPTKHPNSPFEHLRDTIGSGTKLKTKRNSFSGLAPHKASKRVSRSESSPVCSKRIYSVAK